MSFALPARQVTFGRSHVPQQPPPPAHGLALPTAGPGSNHYPTATPLNLALPRPANNNYYKTRPPSQPPQAQSQTSSTGAGPSTPPTTSVPATPGVLTLEQQHITAVEGIVPTLQNIVATVNLDCRLDLKTIALHARNAEYNPKVGISFSVYCVNVGLPSFVIA